MKDKLIKLLKNTEIAKINGHIALAETCFTPHVFENMADHLIANGVTVQEWISVEDSLPEMPPVRWEGIIYNQSAPVLGYSSQGMAVVSCTKDDPTTPLFWVDTDGNQWPITYWMPLPQPPKNGGGGV